MCLPRKSFHVTPPTSANFYSSPPPCATSTPKPAMPCAARWATLQVTRRPCLHILDGKTCSLLKRLKVRCAIITSSITSFVSSAPPTSVCNGIAPPLIIISRTRIPSPLFIICSKPKPGMTWRICSTRIPRLYCPADVLIRSRATSPLCRPSA